MSIVTIVNRNTTPPNNARIELIDIPAIISIIVMGKSTIDNKSIAAIPIDLNNLFTLTHF